MTLQDNKNVYRWEQRKMLIAPLATWMRQWGITVFPGFFRTNLFTFQSSFFCFFLLWDSYSLLFLHVEEDKMER